VGDMLANVGKCGRLVEVICSFLIVNKGLNNLKA